MKAILVDDEHHAIQLFKGVIGLFDNKLEVVGEANDLETAVDLINQHAPDVVFLDIDMPRMSGLKIVDFFDENRDFHLVFVTAHSQFAIEALRIRAFDYLLKPIDAESLEQCYSRLSKKIEQKKSTLKSSQKLVILTHKGLVGIDKNDIVVLEAFTVYCKLYMMDKREYLISKPLGSFLPILGKGFFRVHRSYAINLAHLAFIGSSQPLTVVMNNEHRVSLARNQKNALIQAIQNFENA
jgi:two-component system, LytTR family, response regulator